MAEISAAYVLTTSGGTINFNVATTGGIYRLVNVTGLDDPPLRSPIDDAPMTDGGIVHGAFGGPWHPAFDGILICDGEGATFLSNRTLMEDNLRTALRSIRRATGTLSWTPSGGAARSLDVYYEVAVEYPPWRPDFPLYKRFLFGLVSPEASF